MARKNLRWAPTALLGSFLVLGLSACGNLGLSGEPSEMHVEIEADVGQVTIITSTDWIIITDPGCQDGQQCDQTVRVLEADTTSVAVPFDRRYAFTSTLQYLVIVYPTGGGPATVGMKIDIDGKEWFNERRTLNPPTATTEQGTLEFLYQYTVPRLPGSGL